MSDQRAVRRPEEAPRHYVYVRDLTIGDIVGWAGRWVTVEDTKPYLPPTRRWKRHRPGRYLIVSVESEDHQLHYYDDEWVDVLAHADDDHSGSDQSSEHAPAESLPIGPLAVEES
jgi:hypothetical protein